MHEIGLDQDGLAWGSPARRQRKLEREVVQLVAAVALGETDVWQDGRLERRTDTDGERDARPAELRVAHAFQMPRGVRRLHCARDAWLADRSRLGALLAERGAFRETSLKRTTMFFCI